MALFKRSTDVDEDDPPTIHVGDAAGLGSIYGRRVATGAPVDGAIGTMMQGRPATPANLKAARRWIAEADAGDFEWLDGREVVDRASGQVYEVLLADPLLADDPRGSGASAFFVAGDRIEFIRSLGETLADRERAAAEQAARVAQAEADRRRKRATMKQVSIRRSILDGEWAEMSLRRAAETLVDAGGRIERGEHGELVLSAPERLGDEPLVEHARWVEVARAAQVLAACPAIVLAAVDDLERDGSKRPRSLVERLPDREPAFGGGVA